MQFEYKILLYLYGKNTEVTPNEENHFNAGDHFRIVCYICNATFHSPLTKKESVDLSYRMC